MTTESFNTQVRTDIKELVNKEIALALASGISTDTFAASLTSAMIEASVVVIKSTGFAKKDTQYVIKELLNEIFNDWK